MLLRRSRNASRSTKTVDLLKEVRRVGWRTSAERAGSPAAVLKIKAGRWRQRFCWNRREMKQAKEGTR